MVALQSTEVLFPCLVTGRDYVGVLKLQPDIFEVIAKRRPRQPLHILKDECPRPRLPYRPDRLREHVASIVVGPMFAPHRKRLTGRSAGHQVQQPVIGAEINLAHIALRQAPMLHTGRISRLIFPDRVATITVPLDHPIGPEPRLMQADAQPPSTRKQLDRSHTSKSPVQARVATPIRVVTLTAIRPKVPMFVNCSPAPVTLRVNSIQKRITRLQTQLSGHCLDWAT